ncbi:hypothetical protein BJ912DRAFT_1113167 [Pholiota molesta]|nr:hypothetical protein BJ912DRAFT_1113167 [Pholiota molesta]
MALRRTIPFSHRIMRLPCACIAATASPALVLHALVRTFFDSHPAPSPRHNRRIYVALPMSGSAVDSHSEVLTSSYDECMNARITGRLALFVFAAAVDSNPQVLTLSAARNMERSPMPLHGAALYAYAPGVMQQRVRSVPVLAAAIALQARGSGGCAHVIGGAVRTWKVIAER